MGAKDSTSTTTNTPPPYVAAAYKDLLKQATPISNTPYTPFAGGSSNDIQKSAQGQIAGLAGNTNANFTGAANLLNTTANTPTSSLIGQYENPYQKDVVDATMANIGETNAQQQQQVRGNAIQKGAMGGDRVAVAQSELARQQGLAGNATLANLNSQNYSQALTAAQTQKQQATDQATAMSGLGTSQNNAGLQNAAANLSAGDSQYARDYAQYQAAKSYPFETTGWLANIVEGVGAGAGGTSTATTPAGNTGSSILGGVLSMASLMSDERVKENKQVIGRTFDGQPIYRFNYKGDTRTQMGLMAQEVEKKHPEAVNENEQGLKMVNYHQATEDAADRKRFAGGGVIPMPYATDMTASAGQGTDYLGRSYVPQLAPVQQRQTMPTSSASTQRQPDALDAMTNKTMQQAQQKGADNIKALAQGVIHPADASSPNANNPSNGVAPAVAPAPSGANGVAPASNVVQLPTAAPAAPVAAPVAAVPPVAADSAGGLGGLAHLFGFAEGGAVRRAYAGGGNTGDWVMPDALDWTNEQAVPVGAPAPIIPVQSPMPAPEWNGPDKAGALVRGDDLYRASPSMPASGYDQNGFVGRVPSALNTSTPLVGSAPVAAAPAFDDQTNFGPSGVAPVAPAAHGWVARGIPAFDQPTPAVASNGVAPIAGVAANPDKGGIVPLGAPIDVPTVPLGGMTAAQANAEDPNSPVGALTPRQSARVAAGQPITLPPTGGKVPAGAQNWVQSFQNAGLPPMQAAIMAGNVQVESSFNPTAYNKKENAHGAMQWEGDRWDAKSPNSLQSFAAKAGTDWRDPQTQANFMRWEGENIPRLKSSWNQFLAAKTPQQAQEALAGFIGYKRDDAHGNDANRLANGLRIMNNPGQTAYPPTMTALAGRGGNDVTGSIGPAANSNGVAPMGLTETQPQGGLFGNGDLLNKIGIHMTDNQRSALLSAGLGMMAGTSPNFLTNVGTGGLKGVEEMNALKDLQQKNALAQSTITTRAGELANEAARTKADIGLTQATTGQTQAQTGKIGTEAQIMKYDYSRGPYGMMVIDKTNPTAGAQLIRPGDIATSPIAQAAIQQRQAAGIPDNGQYAHPPATTPVASPPPSPPPVAAVDQTGAAAPVAPPPQSSGLIPPIPRAAVDPRGLYPEGQAVMMDEQKQGLARAETEYQGAQEARVQTQQMRQTIGALPPDGLLAQGPGFETRLGFVNAYNAGLRVLGVDAAHQIAPEAVAAGEDLNKLTKQAGFSAAGILGKGEAASTIDKVLSAIPGGANSPQGAQLILKTIESSQQRKIDHYQFLQNWVQAGNPSLFGAEDYFNRVNPPQMYGVMALSGPQSIAMLRQHPDTLPQFTQQWGAAAGSLAKRYVLGQ